jgi:hypothetical protein
MTDNALKIVAAAERTAEQNKSLAEGAWRRAWWATTLILGQPTYRPDITDALDTAQEILGQSRSYLSDRRATGVVFADVSTLIDVLPPRLSMAWAAAHAGQKATADDIAEIVTAEHDGLSLREFAARYDQRFEKPRAERVPPSELSPEQVVEAARSNPAVVDALAADRETREAVEDAGIRHRADARPDTPAGLNTPEGRADAKESARRRVEGLMGDQTDEATNYLVGAAHELGHALFARERWGITQPGAEADAVAAIDRLMAIYKAEIAGSGLTSEDRQFLDSIGVTA